MNESIYPDDPDRIAVTARCSECGAIGYPNDKYCASCGNRMRTTCAGCNAVIRQPVAWFCPQCGHPLSKSETICRP